MQNYQLFIRIGAVAVSARAYDGAAIADPWNKAELLINVQLKTIKVDINE